MPLAACICQDMISCGVRLVKLFTEHITPQEGNHFLFITGSLRLGPSASHNVSRLRALKMLTTFICDHGIELLSFVAPMPILSEIKCLCLKC